MIIKIEIDEARSAKIVEWLAGKFDYMTRSATERGALAANATAAKTPEGAVNNIRFKLYGTRPAKTLAPFHAEPKRFIGRGNIPISRAAERLAKLAQAGRA